MFLKVTYLQGIFQSSFVMIMYSYEHFLRIKLISLNFTRIYIFYYGTLRADRRLFNIATVVKEDKPVRYAQIMFDYLNYFFSYGRYRYLVLFL